MTPAEKIEMQWAYLCHVNAYYVQAVTILVVSRLGLPTPPPAANDPNGPGNAA
jgi:hypothetical protein